MADDRNDPWVRTSDGRVMRLSQFKALQQREITAFRKQMTLAIEQLSGLAEALGGNCVDVDSAKWQLDADMSRIHSAIGTDAMGTRFRSDWDRNFQALKDAYDAVSNNVDAVAMSMNDAADQVLKAENDTLQGFGQTAVDPRVKPGGGRGRGFVM